MTLTRALLLSSFIHFLVFAIAWFDRRFTQLEIDSRQGFAVQILSSGDGDSPGPATGESGTEAKTGRGVASLPGGLFTGSLSELQRSIHYPEEAQAMQMEGTVHIEVTIGNGGSVVAARVTQSSGHRILDEAAMTGVKQWTFSDRDSGMLVIPFRFRLQ
ncbi:MAG: energy transducer TonB [Spirochaetia bacterium]|nr:energy transducer TonB [Spirochaetia bacterium]